MDVTTNTDIRNALLRLWVIQLMTIFTETAARHIAEKALKNMEEGKYGMEGAVCSSTIEHPSIFIIPHMDTTISVHKATELMHF